MKLMCQLWFWFAVANTIVTYGLLTVGDYPRSRSAVPRWADALSVITNASLAVYLYVVIWRP
jgi:hypothetical protein